MADRHSTRDPLDHDHGEPDRLDFDHHREERHRSMGVLRAGPSRSSGADRAHGNDYGWRHDHDLPPSSRSRELEHSGYGDSRSRQWTGGDPWRMPGPFAGRGPRGYQRSDERIREELNDRLTAHGFIDATDIECGVQNGEVTLNGFVDSRDTKRAAEDVAEGIQGVHDVDNHLRSSSREDARRADRTIPEPRPESAAQALSPVNSAAMRPRVPRSK
jgi:hypothetical protein